MARKSHSRQARFDRACADLRTVIDAVETCKDQWSEASAAERTQIRAKVKAAEAALDYTELELLRDEMESWRDNMPENLQASAKYDEVDECHSELDSIVSALEDLTWPSAADDSTYEAELSDLCDEFNASLDDYSPTFPGMF